LNHPSPTLINCQIGGIHQPTYHTDNNTFFGTPGNPAPACQHGNQDKVENPNYATIFNGTITGSSANKLIKNDANWNVNAFQGFPVVIKNSIYLIKENTPTAITVHVPQNKPQHDLDSKNLNPGEPFAIINLEQQNNNSPLYNTGHPQEFSERDRKQNSRFAFGRADRGPFELPQDGIFMLPNHKPLHVKEGGMINVKVGIMKMPQENVTINLTGNDETIIQPQTLVFPQANWGQDKLVQISILPNTKVEEDRLSNVTVEGVSNDAKYNKAFPNYVITVQDDDKAQAPKPDNKDKNNGIIINETDGSTNVSKDGQTDTYSIHLEKKPTSVVDIMEIPSSNIALDKHKLRFNRLNWNVPQVITVSALKFPKELPPQKGDNAKLAQQEKAPQDNIKHKVISIDPAYNNIKINPIVVNIKANDNTAEGKDSAKKPTITIADTQCVEATTTKLFAIVSGELNYPQYEWKHISGPEFTLGEMEIRSITDNKAKLMVTATAPDFDPANHRTFMKFIIKDGAQTYDATMMINLLPEETELSKNNVQKVQGKVLGINSNGELMNELEEASFDDNKRFIMLTEDVKLYINDDSEPQLLAFDNYVIFSDFTFDFNRGIIVSFDLTKLTRKDYDLSTLIDLKNPGVYSFKGAYEEDMLGYKIAFGDVDGNGSQEVWALAPFGINDAVFYIFSASGLNPIRRIYESDASKFSTLFTVADINGDQKADFNTATIYTTKSHVPDDYKNEYGQFLAADRLLSYLSTDNMGSRFNIEEQPLDHMITPQNRNDIQEYDDPPETKYLKTQYATAEGEDDSFIELTVSLDMNDDGFDDLALAASDLVVSVYFGSANIEDMTELSVDLSEFITSILSMAVGDVTGDGIADIVLGCNDGIIIIIPGNANLPYDASLTADDVIVIQTESTEDIDSLYVGDTNGDSVAEIAFYDNKENVTNLIDTFNDFASTSNDPTTTSGPSGYQLAGAAGCSLNQADLQAIHMSQDYLTALLLLLSLFLFRIHKNSLQEKIRTQTIMIRGKKHEIMIRKF
ncbi:VCBS repeat-containing protein, partial [bacterium]|nr:VCBS repeat-containing protein [bacterium]MBU1917349.1 VCBS repeat-containing protein [bacterium]